MTVDLTAVREIVDKHLAGAAAELDGLRREVDEVRREAKQLRRQVADERRKNTRLETANQGLEQRCIAAESVADQARTAMRNHAART